MHLLILIVNALCFSVLAKDPPKWSSRYAVKGVLYFSNGEIEEPFQAWYDEESGRSRIDYYNGIVSTYQFRDEGDYGKHYRFIPITTFKYTNKMTCYQIDGKPDINNNDNNENENTEKTDNENNANEVNEENEENQGDQENQEITDTIENSSSGSGDSDIDEVTVPISENLIRKRRDVSDENDTKKDSKRIQSVFPDCSAFKYAGSEWLFGNKCYKFVFEDQNGEETTKYTMWVRYIKSSGSKKAQTPVPVRYEMQKSHAIHGSNYDQFHIDYRAYKSYLTDNVLDSIFKIDQDCATPEYIIDETIRTIFNPMKGFVDTIDSNNDVLDISTFLSELGLEFPTTKENQHRKNIFMQNLRYIHSMNRRHLGFTLAVNQFTDRTREELRALRGYKLSGKHNGGKPFPYELDTETTDSLPESLDWRLSGAVTPVKDQTSFCGSCWAFAATGAIEGALFVHEDSNELVHLSEQALIDCSWGYENNGCDGGEDASAFKWVKKMRGIPTDESYGSYKAQEGLCHVKHSDVVLKAPITGWVNVTSGDPNAMKLALLKHGPVSVAIHSTTAMDYYSNGVFFDPTCESSSSALNHAVLVVGYGVLNGEQYWLIRNSYGTSWGNAGYMMIAARKNHCGVLTAPTYVTF